MREFYGIFNGPYVIKLKSGGWSKRWLSDENRNLLCSLKQSRMNTGIFSAHPSNSKAVIKKRWFENPTRYAVAGHRF